MNFSSIRIEGGLLGPELLDQVVAGDLTGQKPADFGLEARRNLTDEIAAVFPDTRALWGVFEHRLSPAWGKTTWRHRLRATRGRSRSWASWATN